MGRGFDLNLGLEEEDGEGKGWGDSPGGAEEEGEESGGEPREPGLDMNAAAGGPGEDAGEGEDEDDEEEEDDDEEEDEEDEEAVDEEAGGEGREEGDGEEGAAAAREDAEGVDEAAADIEAELERGEDEEEDEREGEPAGAALGPSPSPDASPEPERTGRARQRPEAGRRAGGAAAERLADPEGAAEQLGEGRGEGGDGEEYGGRRERAESDGSDYNAVDEDEDLTSTGGAAESGAAESGAGGDRGAGEALPPPPGAPEGTKGGPARQSPAAPPDPKRYVIKKRPVGARPPDPLGGALGAGGRGGGVRSGGASVRDVAEHYSARENQRVDVRESSPIIHLKKLNNWIKSVLIRRYTQPGDYVLDLACGKGGDLIKWDFAKIGFYLGVDVAKGSIYDAAARYNGESMEDASLMTRKYHFPAKLVCADCYGVPLANDLAQFGPFDVCSCQFALHYSFQSEARARQALSNVAELLAPGGYFIGTIPDANVIVRKLRAAPGLKFGNLVYSVEFDPQFHAKSFPKGNPFGIEYLFNLEDAVACPEWLIPFPSLQALAAEYGLELVERMNFHDFIHRYVEVEELAKIMQRVVGREWHNTITKDEWDAAYLYCAFVFKKAGEKEALGKRRREDEGPKKYRVDSDDILFL